MGHGHLDPGWYDYPSLLMAVLAPVQALFGAPVVPRRPPRRRRARARRGRRDVVARSPRVRHRRGDRRRSSGRRRDDARRLLADGRHGRAADARRHLRARARRRGPHRVGRARGRSRRVGQVPGGDRGRARGRRGVGEVEARSVAPAALAVAGFALTSPFVLIHAGAAWDDISRVQRLARAGWLGFENDPIAPLAYLDRLWDAVGPLLIVAAVGVVAALLRRTKADLDPALVRARLLADADAAAGPLRALHPPARPRPGRPRRERPAGGAVRARGARAPARVERVRRARADAHRHPPAGRRLGRRQRPRRRPDRGRSLDPAASRPPGRAGSSCPGPGGRPTPSATWRGCVARA